MPTLELAAPIAAGRTAEVFAYGDGRVLKLLRPGFPARLGEQEARLVELVAKVYDAAPRYLGTEAVDGRFGLVFERVVGPTMDARLRSRLWEVAHLGRTLGRLHAEMHDASGAGLPDQSRTLRDAIERATPELPDGAADAALARLDQLPTGGVLCHGDVHPGNVILGADRTVVIDWENARSGSAAADVARAVYLMADTPIPNPRALRPLVVAVRRRFVGAYLAGYRERRAMTDRELRAWRLPILAARMAEGIEDERAALRAAITTELPASRPG